MSLLASGVVGGNLLSRMALNVDEGSDVEARIGKLIVKTGRLYHAIAQNALLACRLPEDEQRFCKSIKKLLLYSFPYASDKRTLCHLALFLFHNSPKDALCFAIHTGDIHLVRRAIEMGADVNVPLYPRMSALLLACKQGHAEIALFLLSCGAAARFVGGTHHHETPLSEALLRPVKMQSCLEELIAADGGFTKELMTRKLLAHEFSLKGLCFADRRRSLSSLSRRDFKWLGLRTRVVLDAYLKEPSFYHALRAELAAGSGATLDRLNALLPHSLTSIQREQMAVASEELLEMMQHSLDSDLQELYLHPQQMMESLSARLALGKPAICFGVTRTDVKKHELHAWGLVITKDLSADATDYNVQLCNRGAGSGEHPGIIEKKMDRAETFALMQSCVEAFNWKRTSSKPDNKALIEVTKRFLEGAFVHVPMDVQSCGNCCDYSHQAIEVASWRALLSRIVDREEGDILSLALQEESATHRRQQRLNAYLSKPHTPGIDFDYGLLAAICTNQKVSEREPIIELLKREHKRGEHTFDYKTGLPYLYIPFLFGGKELLYRELEEVARYGVEELILWAIDNKVDLDLVEDVLNHPTILRRFPQIKDSLISRIQFEKWADSRFGRLLDLKIIPPHLLVNDIGTANLFNPKTLKILDASGIDINERDEMGKTPLIRAASFVSDQLVARKSRIAELTKAAEEFDKRRNEGQLAEDDFEALIQEEELSEKIKKETADLHVVEFYFGEGKGKKLQIEMCNVIIELGADKERTDPSGLRAYDYALKDENADLAELLR
ncbi:MAG: ankyrin repeat domain-containing protein [Chlamydiota bacterium]